MKKFIGLFFLCLSILSCNSISNIDEEGMLLLSGLSWTLTVEGTDSQQIIGSDDFSDLMKYIPENRGIMTISTTFSLPESKPGAINGLYGLYAGRIITADQIYINGTLVGRTGRFPPDWHNDWNKDRFYSIPAKLLNSNSENEISIRIFVNNEGLIDGPLLFGPYYQVQRIHQIKRFLHQDVNALIAAVFLFFSLYNLFIYYRRKKDSEFLWFAVLTLIFSVNHTSLFMTSIPGFDYRILSPLQWMKFYTVCEFVLTYSALRFFEAFGRLNQNGKIRYLIFTIPLLFLMFTLFLEDYGTLRSWLGYFEFTLLLPICYFLIRLYINRSENKRIIPLLKYGLLPALITILHDLTLPHLIPGYSVFIAGAGLPLFLMTTNIILAHEFVKDRNQIENMNQNLEALVQARSLELSRANEKIEELSRKDRFISEFELTPREKEILRYILDGHTNDTIADSLSVSIRTINTHLYNLYKKVGVHSRVEIFSRFNNEGE